MALFDLNRAGDTPISTLKLASITPIDWPRAVLPGLAETDANANAGKPRYTSMTDWAGGAKGDDVDVATATVALANQSGGAAEADYTPRTQAAKSTALGVQNPLAVDVARPRGSIAPQQPYPVAGDTPVAAPVVSSISPTTAPAAQLPLLVTITGTGFSIWSTVYTGGSATPDPAARFVDSTHMTVPIWAAAPGTVSVAVEDHNVLSNTDKLFTVT